MAILHVFSLKIQTAETFSSRKSEFLVHVQIFFFFNINPSENKDLIEKVWKFMAQFNQEWKSNFLNGG